MVAVLEGKLDEAPALTKKVKYLTTLAIFLECTTFGCAFNLYSPTLVDLKNKYMTDIETISKVFTILSAAYLVGAFAGGVLYNHVIKRQHGVVITFIGMAVALFLTPHCPTILYLYIGSGVLGFSCGAYDTATFAWIMEMWGSKCGPIVQAQHFSFALGSVIPSVLTFLTVYFTRQTLNIENENSTFISMDENISEIENDHKIITVPFTICGIAALFNAAFELFLIACYPYTKPLKESKYLTSVATTTTLDTLQLGDNEKEVGPEIKEKDIRLTGSKWHRVNLILLSGIFLGFYVGMELCSIHFIPTIAQIGKLQLTEAEGAIILTGLTGAFSVGRAIGIVITLKMSPQLILFINAILIILGNAILLFWGDSSREMLWAGCIVLGFGFSTMYASFCAYMEKYLIFTDFVVSVMLISASIVGVIYPIVVGKFIEENALIVTWTNFLSVAICVLAFIVLYCITAKRNNK